MEVRCAEVHGMKAFRDIRKRIIAVVIRFLKIVNPGP